MSNTKTIQAIVTLIPVAIDLTTRLLNFAKAAKEDGYEVPTIEKLQELNDALKALPDLE
jgi:hypothetical protein